VVHPALGAAATSMSTRKVERDLAALRVLVE
jgi:hypothetical protein